MRMTGVTLTASAHEKCVFSFLLTSARACSARYGAAILVQVPPVFSAANKKREPNFGSLFYLVRMTGLEPARPFDHKNLNLTRLPIPPHPQAHILYHNKSRLSRNLRAKISAYGDFSQVKENKLNCARKLCVFRRFLHEFTK